MANVRKFSSMSDVGHMCAHYERSVENDNYSNTNIDRDKIYLDRTNLAPDRGKQTDYIKDQIEKLMDGRTMRKDAIRMCCWVVDAPKDMSEEVKPRVFQAAYDFLIDRYGEKSGMGEDVVISSYIHHSETTSHMHFAFLPVIKKNGQKTFCAKECIGRNDLRTFHEDLGSYMEQRGICRKKDILNGETKKDSKGKALSVDELKRERFRERTRDRWTNPSNRTYERERS